MAVPNRAGSRWFPGPLLVSEGMDYSRWDHRPAGLAKVSPGSGSGGGAGHQPAPGGGVQGALRCVGEEREAV